MVYGTTAFLDYVLSLEADAITSEEIRETITPAEYLWRKLATNNDADVYLPDAHGEPRLQVLHLNKVVRRVGVRITEYVATCFDTGSFNITTVTMRATQSLLVLA